MPKASEQLQTLGIELPPVPKPVASYVPCVRHNDLLILSGQIPIREGKVVYTGQVGRDLDVETAQQAARLCAINAIAVAADAAGGVDNIQRVLKVVVYVASADDFSDQHVVANGTSNFLQEVFGEAGIHARAAVGLSRLPLDSAVEIDVTFVA